MSVSKVIPTMLRPAKAISIVAHADVRQCCRQNNRSFARPKMKFGDFSWLQFPRICENWMELAVAWSKKLLATGMCGSKGVAKQSARRRMGTVGPIDAIPLARDWPYHADLRLRGVGRSIRLALLTRHAKATQRPRDRSRDASERDHPVGIESRLRKCVIHHLSKGNRGDVLQVHRRSRR